jgi:CheY-like chemotaxis protein
MEPTPIEVLLVDDNAFDLELTIRALKRTRIPAKISIARDGAEALDFAFAWAQRDIRGNFSLVILLDLNLPLVDGIEVLREIRAHPVTCGVPVFILMSSDHEREVVQNSLLKVNSYIRKPVVPERFTDAMKAIGLAAA